ncbi:Bro-N domain-containing protein [Glaesserella parasuis]|uniref:BRO-N domain-containing protein n=1 Tax=Glaesserella parasuis TaxID=738 RepID=UPI000689AEC9|nr:Bro-N domain-containing protein [Glaesserella parasuis]
MTTLTFQNTAMTVISQKNKTFFTSFDLGKALGYKNPSADIPNLYNRNADEFTAEMTALIELQTAGGKQQVRVFSLRGAHLIAMFARTKVAKDFRKWVLDILDREISENEQQIAPLEPKPDVVLPHEKAEQIAKYLVRARAFAKEVEVFHRKLYEDLGISRYVKNDIAGKAYDIAHEFNVWLDPFIEQVLPQINQQRLANF